MRNGGVLRATLILRLKTHEHIAAFVDLPVYGLCADTY